MKKTLLFLFAACTLGLQAQNVLFNDSFTLPRENKIAAGNDLIAVTPQGDVYVTGVFTDSLKFGTDTLLPLGASTYLIKYDKTGAKQWAVSFQGASTPTAITIADDGTVYVAGTLADEVKFGSTDQNTISKFGIKDKFEEYVQSQCAAFIAEYSSLGVLSQVKTYLTEPLDFFEDPYYKDVKLNFTSLKKEGNELIAGLVITGKYQENGISLSGSYFDFYGIVAEDVKTAAIVSISSNLELNKLFVSLGTTDGELINFEAASVAFDTDQNNLYAAFGASGKQNLKIAGNTISTDFNVIEDSETKISKGFILVIIKKDDLTLIKKAQYQNQATSDLYKNNIEAKELFFNGLNLYLTGSFGTDCPFNNQIISGSLQNLFITNLSASDLSVTDTNSSNSTEKEIVSGSAMINNDYLYVSALNGTLLINDLESNLSFTTSRNKILNSITSTGNYYAEVFADTNSTPSTLNIILNEISATGLNDIENKTINIYPNPVVKTLNISEESDITIYNLTGSVVLEAQKTKSVDVEFLPNGSYIASVSNANGVKRMTLIKK